MPADPTTGSASGRKATRSSTGSFNRLSFALGQWMPTKIVHARGIRANTRRQLRQLGGR